MIADRTYMPFSFLAARLKSRLHLAAPTGQKATRVLAHRAFQLRGQEHTVSDGSWPITARIARVLALLPPHVSMLVFAAATGGFNRLT